MLEFMLLVNIAWTGMVGYDVGYYLWQRRFVKECEALGIDAQELKDAMSRYFTVIQIGIIFCLGMWMCYVGAYRVEEEKSWQSLERNVDADSETVARDTKTESITARDARPTWAHVSASEQVSVDRPSSE